MDLGEAIWKLIESRPKIDSEQQKRALYVDIMRAVDLSKTQVGKRLGATIMTQEASQAGDRVNQSPGYRGTPGEPKPKSV